MSSVAAAVPTAAYKQKLMPQPVRLISIQNKRVVVQPDSVGGTKSSLQNGDKAAASAAVTISTPPKTGETVSSSFTATGVPDIRGWNVENVHEYFKKRFPQDAVSFRNARIDGIALLELDRQDVVERMKLTLGPALNMWRLIREMQEKARNQ